MFWARKLGAAALAALMLSPAIAEAGVVVASSGPSARSYPIGLKLADGARIALQGGDSVTVLDGTATRVLRGQGTFTIGQQGGTTRRTAFAVLTEQRAATRMRTGAVRNAETTGPVRPPNLWYVDVDQAGTVCLAGTDAVRLWRAGTDASATYSLGEAGGANRQSITFAKGEALARWDSAALPVRSGAAYQIAKAGGQPAGTVTFVVLQPAAGDPEALAQQLIENGCTRQLEVLSDTLLVTAR